ncbi:TonB-dependent receptor [Chitinophaga pendula]|uniref:TonB-dependent receptor domain-containing protein n=1 Tax=Chitinophaga TaxID=79328 RepID=UPI000BAFE722|nr:MULTISPECIES: TonB-dependent receptor [Chitinophaga]ASZ11786.1 TonB-dependent receptor [Chitinophaga sp. MD30]UCJ05193.1 TonB-dependent receptor [Chitinophaga pendula]
MKRIITIIIIIISLLYTKGTFAQIQLKGTVLQKTSTVAWANVILTDAGGQMTTGALTKENGSFILTAKPGHYTVKISFLGLNDWSSSVQLDKDTDLGTIHMTEKTGQLAEVIVSARKKMIEYKADRLVLNVENNINAIGGNGINAIKSAPGIIIGKDGNISMLGRGAARVMVDGRLIELTGPDLVDYLNTISANDIKSVEVISNPPARYDAGSTGGLINIILKKGAANAWKNTTSFSADQQRYNAFNLRNNFFYNKNRIKLSANLGGKLGAIHTREDINTYYPAGPWNLNVSGKQKENNISGGLALDYDLSDRTTIGIQYMGSHSTPNTNNVITIGIHNAANQLDSLLINDATNILGITSHTANAHLVSRLDTLGRQLSFDIDFFDFNSGFDNNFVANSYNPAGKFLNAIQAARNVSNQHIRNGSFKIDIEHPLKFARLSYGAKVSIIDSRASVNYYNTLSGPPEWDPNRSNDFNYRENNQAIYINGARDFGSKFSLQLGLRAEHTSTKGHSLNTKETNTNEYLKWFPTAFLSFKANAKNTWMFNYGRRINRPGFRNLNPARAYINSNSYSEGNPFLQPSFVDNFELSHVYRSTWRTSLFFSNTTNGFGTVFTSDQATNIQIISRQNYFREAYFGISETYSNNITPWWQTQINLSIMGSNTRFTNHINATPMNGVQFFGAANNTFNLGKNTALQVDYSYSSPFKRGLFSVGYMSGLDIGIKQSLLDKKLQLSLLINDVFNTNTLKDYASTVNGIRQVYAQNYSSRFVRLSLSYSFGNNKINVKKRTQGNTEEFKRAAQ